MNYYIQGNKDRAEEIKAAFEKLGYDVTGFNMCNDNILFFTYKLQTGGQVLSTTNANLYTADIIKTHPDYKELELPIEPCFKVGDNIRSKSTQMTYTIIKIDVVNKRYELDYCSVMDFKEQDKFELAPKPNYDIANFKPFDKVLVRDRNSEKWRCAWFSDYDKTLPFSFVTTGADYHQCIPFEGNEHLLGTTDLPNEEYINW